MKTMQNLVCKALLAAVLLFPMQLLAHTGLKTSNPADGSTLQAAPASIELVYTADVRLIRVEITSNGEKVATGSFPSRVGQVTVTETGSFILFPVWWLLSSISLIIFP